MELHAVVLIDDGLDDVGFVVYEFSVAWDDEHGASVIMHRDRVLAAAGGAEFGMSAEGVREQVKYMQETFGTDEGDLVLD